MKPSDHPYSIETLAIDVADTHDRKLTKEATADGHQGSLNATQTIPVTTTEGTELPDGRYLLDIGLELNNCDLGGPAGVSTSIPIDLVTP